MGDKQAIPDLSAASSVKAQHPSLAAPLSQLRHSFSAPPGLPCLQVKFMCSHGGLVLPRPSDLKLRYVGGETRIFSAPRHICYADFLGKMTEIYGQGLTLKYQLPEEDLDALVSVCSDDDLENMMEECARVDSSLGLSKLRVFIFSSSELDAADLSDMSDTKILEERYVDAVNALMPEASFRIKSDLAFADFRMNSEGGNAFVWNATNMQENSSFLSEKPQSEAIFVPTGNALLSKTRLPEYVGAATSPPHAPAHSTFRRQPAVLETAPEVALDRFENTSGFRGATSGVDTLLDLDCCSSASSSTSSHHELHHRASDSMRISSSPMQALKEWTLDQKEEDHAYRVAQRCIADDVMHVATSNEKLQRREPSDLQNNRCELASADDNERLDNRLHTNLPWSTSNLQQKQLEPVWGQVQIPSGDKVVVVDPMRNPPRNVSFGQQQAFPMEQLQPPQNLLLCNPSATLDKKIAVHGQIEEYSPEDSSGVSKVFPPEAQSNLQQTSTSVYQTGDSAPSSPTLEKLKATGKPGAFPLEGQIHQMPMTGQELPTILYDYDGSCKNKDSCCNSGHSSWSFLNPENTLSDNLMDPHHLGSNLVDVADLHFDGLPILAWSSTIPRQQMPSNFQNNEDATGAEAFSTRLQTPSLSFLEESLPTANLAAAVQSQNEQFHTSGHIPLHLGLVAPVSAAIRGDTPTLGMAMVLESMQSCRSSNGLPAEILVADMSTSMPQGSPLETCQGGDNFRAREKTESAVQKIGVIQPSMSVQRDTQDKSFAPAQDSVSSREQFNKIRCHFDEDMDIDDAKSLEIFREKMPTTSNSAHVLPSSLLNATWESSFPQSEHVHSVFIENSLKEHGLEGLAIENEVTYEDFTVEIEELDRFESLADPTSNAAVLAEQEAISRGLQIINNFDLEELRELGSGTFGTVYHGKWRGTDVAIKRIKSSCFTGRQSERERLIADFWREAYILGQLHHPNVVAFYGVVPDGPGGTLATVTEFMVNGSLKQVLQKKDRTLDRRKRLLIAMDAAFGMEYLHGKNVVHFDIKCENLLVNLRDTQRPICKVGDLGLSKVKQQTMVSGGVRGTLPWMAPELLNGTSSLVSEKVDVFSFGIVLWELLTGEEPYANMHYGAIIGGIVNNTLRPPIPIWCDPAWRILMEKCWSAEPAERPTFTEIAGSLRMMEVSLNTKGQPHELTAGS